MYLGQDYIGTGNILETGEELVMGGRSVIWKRPMLNLGIQRLPYAPWWLAAFA